MKQSRIRQFTISAVVSLALLAGYYWKTSGGGVSEVPLDFTIPSTQGSFKLSDYRGQTVFLFFGFTRCPHICPTTLNQLSGLFKKLSTEQVKKTKVLFVSIDPDIDNMDVLKKHMSYFGDSFIGATDTDENLKKITDLFGANYSRKGAIDHTSTVFVINQLGYLVDILPYTVSSDELYTSYEQSFERPSIMSVIKNTNEVDVLADNTECDLSKSVCEIKINDKDTFVLKVSPQPIKTESELQVELMANSLNYEPQSIDISGVELNMGYIRPEFQRLNASIYKTSFTLPVCELSTMNWVATVYFKTKDGHLKTPVVKYKFTTVQENRTQ